MSNFTELAGYRKPTITKINEKVSMAVYVPEKKNPLKKSIISIYNTTNNGSIQLYSDTLVSISNIFINSILLNVLPKRTKKIKNKRNKKK